MIYKKNGDNKITAILRTLKNILFFNSYTFVPVRNKIAIYSNSP